GHQNDVIRDLGVFAHQQGAQNIVDQTDDQHAEQGQDDARPDGASNQEGHGDWHPDDGGADGWHQRQEGHQHTPQQCALYAQKPEHEPAQGALRGGNNDIALDGGPDYRGELAEQVLLMFIA